MTNQIKWKRCKNCGLELPEKFFPLINRKKISGMYTYQKTYRSAVCMDCRDTKRDEKKKQNRCIVKARNAIYRHADKYIKKGVVSSRAEFRQLFGWSVERLAHDFEYQYGNSCSICGEPYSGMGHGLQDITIDIRDIDILPYYATNVQFVCMTDNRRKSRTPPEDYGEIMLGWRIVKEHKQKLKNDRWAGLPLFEGMESNKQLQLSI